MMLIRGSFYEEIEIFESLDFIDIEAARGWCSGCWAVPWTGDQYSADLSIAFKVWRYECVWNVDGDSVIHIDSDGVGIGDSYVSITLLDTTLSLDELSNTNAFIVL